MRWNTGAGIDTVALPRLTEVAGPPTCGTELTWRGADFVHYGATSTATNPTFLAAVPRGSSSVTTSKDAGRPSAAGKAAAVIGSAISRGTIAEASQSFTFRSAALQSMPQRPTLGAWCVGAVRRIKPVTWESGLAEQDRTVPSRISRHKRPLWSGSGIPRMSWRQRR